MASPSSSEARTTSYRRKTSKSFKDAGWDLRAKGAPEHRTLENLLKLNLADDTNGVLGIGKKTVVLIGGEPTNTVLSRVEMYFEAGWSVQLYCFRDKGSEVSDSLRLKYGSSFQNLFLGGSVKNILKGENQGSATLAGDSATRALVDATATSGPPAAASGELRFVLMNLDDSCACRTESKRCFRGVYHELVESDVAAFRDAGWGLRTKGTGGGGNALQDLLKWNLVDDGGDDEGGDTKTMVLVEGELSNSRLNQVEKYVEAGWNVQLYCFRAKGKTVSDRLRTQYPSSFKSVFFDRFVSNLLKDMDASDSSSALVQPSPATLNSPRSSARFVFMDLDVIVQMIFTSRTLYKTVLGAKASGDIRLSFKALTKLVCTTGQGEVLRRVATYATTKSLLVHQLQQLGWKMEKHTSRTMAAAHERMLKEALSMTESVTSKTLVLVIGNKGPAFPDRRCGIVLLLTYSRLDGASGFTRGKKPSKRSPYVPSRRIQDKLQ